MNILIIGCGRVGSELAELLDKRGHDVSVIDRRPENFDRLPGDFSGFTTTGVPIDQNVLRKAGKLRRGMRRRPGRRPEHHGSSDG